MAAVSTSITFKPRCGDVLGRVATTLSKLRHEEYYAYERDGVWYLGIGSRASLRVDPTGRTATLSTDGKEEVRPIYGPIADEAREFITEYGSCGQKVFGYAGFNYALHARGITYTPGQWPLLSLMAPRTEIVIRSDEVTLKGIDDREVKHICLLLNEITCINPSPGQAIDTGHNAGKYIAQVQGALAEIAQAKYTKIIPSRAIQLPEKVDMPATLLCGRRENNPARTFCFSHSGYQATGFSPELVMALQDGRVVTEPLAGTRAREGAATNCEKLKQELLSDPKEIVEHVISVREALDELNILCSPGTVVVDDLMSVRPRGSVQHLGSTVSGSLAPDKDAWDAFDVLFPSITASGIPKQAAMEGIQRLEHQARELYSGAVLLIEDSATIDAALVLRTVFQDRHCQWLQAGAGVIEQSSPKRELTETREKLASIAPYVVLDLQQ